MENTTPVYQVSMKDILKNSWKLFTENFREIIIITLIVGVPIALISSCFDIWNPNVSTTSRMNLERYLDFFIGIIGAIAIIIYLSKKINNKETSIKGALLGATSIYRRVIVTSIVAGFFIILLSLLLIVPGVIYSVYWFFVTYAVILYGKNMKDARKYSYDVVKGRWWKVAWYNFCFGIMFFIISFLAGAAIGFVIGFVLALASSFGHFNFIYSDFNFMWSMIGGIIGYIVQSFFTVVYFIFFISLDSNRITVVEEKK